ncbi:proteasome inhibitor PI31 subunit-like [Argonauta hians]
MANYPGLELLFRSVELNSVQDAAICFLHWEFITNGFKIPIGTELSEVLPPDWNGTPDVYVLKYCKKTDGDKLKQFLMKAIPLENTLSINLMNLENDVLASISIETEEYVNPDYKFFPNAYKNINDFKTLIDEGLIQVTCPEPTNPSRRSTERSPSHVSQHNRPQTSFIPTIPNQNVPFRQPPDPYAYGARDLDPLGQGSGMMFDPMRNQHNFGPLPRPRFDLMGPPGVLPDNDHLRRPDYNDFM